MQSSPSLKIYCPDVDAKTFGVNLTVVLTDPDAPSRESPEWSEFCHWIGTFPVGGGKEEGLGFGELDLSVRSGGIEDIVECKRLNPP